MITFSSRLPQSFTKSSPINTVFISYQQRVPTINQTNVICEDKPKRVSRFRFGVSEQLINQLSECSDATSSLSFVDEYYYQDLMENNIWIKKRSFKNHSQPVEWIAKFDSNSTNGFEYCEVKYEQNPISIPITEAVAKCTVSRTMYTINSGTVVTIDKISFPKGDKACCGVVDNFGHADEQTLGTILKNCLIPIHSTLFEYLFRYNQTLYNTLKDKFFPELEIVYQCILEEQYKEMEKEGIEKYLELIDICQGTGFQETLEDYDDYMNELYKDM